MKEKQVPPADWMKIRQRLNRLCNVRIGPEGSTKIYHLESGTRLTFYFPKRGQQAERTTSISILVDTQDDKAVRDIVGRWKLPKGVTFRVSPNWEKCISLASLQLRCSQYLSRASVPARKTV